MANVTFNTLKAKYEAIEATSRENTNKFQAGEITSDEWVAVYDACIKKFAGWRKQTINHLAKICGRTYREQAAIYCMDDNIDLYFKFVRKGGNI